MSKLKHGSKQGWENGMQLNTPSKKGVASGTLGHLKDTPKPSGLWKCANPSFFNTILWTECRVGGHPKRDMDSQVWKAGAHIQTSGGSKQWTRECLPSTRPPPSSSQPGLLFGVPLTPSQIETPAPSQWGAWGNWQSCPHVLAPAISLGKSTQSNQAQWNFESWAQTTLSSSLALVQCWGHFLWPQVGTLLWRWD